MLGERESNEDGKNPQKNIIRPTPKLGLIRNKINSAFKGKENDFLKSLRTSSKGCKIPINDLFIGPFRCCPKLKIFRSSKEKNATLSILVIIKTRTLIKTRTSKLDKKILNLTHIFCHTSQGIINNAY